MARSNIAVLLVGAMFAWSIGLNLKVDAKVSSLDIDAKLKLLNKPAVKTIKSEDGDIIDCVDIYKQPAFDHPALKNHTIQMAPSIIPKMQNSKAKKDKSVAAKSVTFQTWQKSGSCPNGTIPIRRILKKDLLRFSNSLDRFGTKPPQLRTFNSSSLKPESATGISKSWLSRSVLATTANCCYKGAQADINIWNPYVDPQYPDDFTTAQIWLQHGTPVFDSIEAGWAVNPPLYGDHSTRLFAYWTRDSYQTTGCFDLTCPGFVLTGTSWALGGTVGPNSETNGSQIIINILIFRDPASGNWWLKVGNLEVGYWPNSLFGALGNEATYVAWGGEVSSPHVKTTETPHTKTEMGSGESGKSGMYTQAAFVSSLRITEDSLTFKYPPRDNTKPSVDEADCYATYYHQEMDDPAFYFGGPTHTECPLF